LQSVYHDDFAGGQTLSDGAKAIHQPAWLHLPVGSLAVFAHYQHELLALVSADGLVVDQYRGMAAAANQLQARKQAWRELPVLVRKDGACADSAGVRVELVIDKHHAALVRVALLTCERQEYGVGSVATAGTLAEARHLDVLQVHVFIALELGIDGVDGDEGGEHRGAAASRDEIPRSDFRLADPATDRCRDARIGEVGARRADGGCADLFGGLGLLQGCRAGGAFLAGNGVAGQQAVCAGEFFTGKRYAAMGRRLFGLCALQRRAVDAVV